jgi:hypothetical protein
MKEIHTEIEINAPAEKVWRVLTDFAADPDWNPFVRRVEGEVSVGARLHVYIQPSGGKGMSFRPTVLVADPDREFRWLGHLWLPGLFDGEHSFSIEPLVEFRSLRSVGLTSPLLPIPCCFMPARKSMMSMLRALPASRRS